MIALKKHTRHKWGIRTPRGCNLCLKINPKNQNANRLILFFNQRIGMEKYHLYHWMPSFSQSVQSNNTSHLIPCKLISPNITYPSLSSPNGQAHTCGWYRELLPGVFRGAAREPKMYSTVPIYCMPLIKPHGRIWCAIVHLYIHKYLMGIYVNHIQYKYTWYTTYKYTSKNMLHQLFHTSFLHPTKTPGIFWPPKKKNIEISKPSLCRLHVLEAL